MRAIILLIGGVLFNTLLSAQNTVSGKVYEQNGDGTLSPLYLANVYWKGTNYGLNTQEDGAFTIQTIPSTDDLVFSFIGMKNDTICIEHLDSLIGLEIILEPDNTLEAVNIEVDRRSTEISLIDPIKFEWISEAEITKAACCNLSESFETNPSVDVAFSDAVTGTRQIQMLGLTGPNIQITREGIPYIRGMSSILGLQFIPGTSIEGMQLNKGTGSVINGYESIAGQINIELRKPTTADKWYFNAFGNGAGRVELNVNRKIKLNDKTSTLIMAHGKLNQIEIDRNKDGFLDGPLNQNGILLNRWKFYFNKGWEAQAGINMVDNYSQGGQVGVKDSGFSGWGMTMDVHQLDSWVKFGKVFKKGNIQSIGNQVSFTRHLQNNKFGNHIYQGEQTSFYYNFLMQGVLGNSNHQFFTGASFQYDQMEEKTNDWGDFYRMEVVPGVFAEYNFSQGEVFDVVLGGRADYHNYFGMFYTPRLHVRYAIEEDLIFRLSGGRGQRTVNVLIENMNMLASSRTFVLPENGNRDNFYGFKPEVAWNLGGNLTKSFVLDYRKGAMSLDVYHTFFENQIVVDMEDPREVKFYNLDGESFATSVQGQIDYELIKRLDVRIAYRYYDVKSTYEGELKTKPLISSHRAFINLGYATRSKWKFDFTANYQGEKRIPSTEENPVMYQVAETSPAFVVFNFQLSKSYEKQGMEWYLGAENALDYRQTNPIIASDQPFGEYFDSALIWGPVFGRMIYGGVRWKIK